MIGQCWDSVVIIKPEARPKFVEHWRIVAAQADDKGKVAICAFFFYNKRGWWVMAPIENLKVLEEVVADAARKQQSD